MVLVPTKYPGLSDKHPFKRMNHPGENLVLWLEEAKTANAAEYNAMSLATVDNHNQPDVRIVYLKHISSSYELLFYTSSYSQKSEQIALQPRVSFCFYWPELKRQLRGKGLARILPSADAELYFASRHRYSQISTWASEQSKTIANRQSLLNKWQHYADKFHNCSIPAPQHWLAFAISLDRLEFWLQGEYRLHERHFCQQKQGKWSWSMLQP